VDNIKSFLTIQGGIEWAGFIHLRVLNNVGFATTALISGKNVLLCFTNIMGKFRLICTKLEMVLAANTRDYRRSRCDQMALF